MTAGDPADAAGASTTGEPGDAAGAATGRTTAVDGGASTGAGALGARAAAWGSTLGELSPLTAGANRMAAIAPSAPTAAAATIQMDRGRSRTRMTVGSCAAGAAVPMLTGATEPTLPWIDPVEESAGDETG